MNKNVKYLSKIFKDNSDFNTREIPIDKKNKIYVAFFESLVNSEMIYTYAIRNIYSKINLNEKIKKLDDVISSPKATFIKDDQQMFYYLENGYALIFLKEEICAIEVKTSIDRGVTMSETEPNMYGPKDSFCENYQKNLGLIKRRIKTKDLIVDTVDRGVYTKTRVSLLYLNDKVDDKALINIKNKLNKYKDYEVTDSFDMTKELSNNSLFPTILKTEKPAIVSKYLLKGYIVVLIDNTPFALILDARFKDFINPASTDNFAKILRYVCFFLTTFTPAIYIALVNFNQETIPSSLLISFSEQRSGVPFPAVIEAFMMLYIVEILRESDIRFPSSYGSSASILGALILGEAAVSAGIVSSIMIIIVAITFITNLIFTEIPFVRAIRILRFGFLLVASFLGLYGLSIGLIVLLFMMASTKMNKGTFI